MIGYAHIEDKTIGADDSSTAVNSYDLLKAGEVNLGMVIPSQNPKLEVHNKKGYGLNVQKNWSDLELTTAHEPIYVAAYVDGTLQEDTVRRIQSPATGAYYFWSSLVPSHDGTPRTNFSGYEVREVRISNASPKVASDGTVQDAGTVTPLSDGEIIRLTATRTTDATPDGEDQNKAFDYVVSYQTGAL